MLDESIFFISNHPSMYEAHLPDQEPRLQEDKSPRDIAAGAPGTSKDEPEKGSMVELIGALYRAIW